MSGRTGRRFDKRGGKLVSGTQHPDPPGAGGRRTKEMLRRALLGRAQNRVPVRGDARARNSERGPVVV